MEAQYKCFFLFNTSDHIKLINLRQQDREKMLEIFRQFVSRIENNNVLTNILVILSKSHSLLIMCTSVFSFRYSEHPYFFSLLNCEHPYY